MNIKTTRGFTLIELLVVIAIIGLLSAVILASLNTARLKAYDASRYSAMQSIQQALALYYSNYGYYPSDLGSSYFVNTAGPALVSDNDLPSVPTDPVYTGTGSDYRYCTAPTVNSTGTGYALDMVVQSGPQQGERCTYTYGTSFVGISGLCSWATAESPCNP
jgi:prepilin-type N-terminal cleavage/methylation domain-containing protein